MDAATKSFINTDDDHAAEKSIWGLAGWSKDGKSVLLYDKYDVWSLPARRDERHDADRGRRRERAGRAAPGRHAQSDRVRVRTCTIRSRRPTMRFRGRGEAAGAGNAGVDLSKPLALTGVRRLDEEVRLLADSGRRRPARRGSSGRTRASAAP